MRAHIVLAHPEPKSFNANLAQISRDSLQQQGYQVQISDLYQMGFDPVERKEHYPGRPDASHFQTQTEQRLAAYENRLPSDVQAEVDHIQACDLLIVHFPSWWFGPPAILKGWMDRVFVYGKLYKSEMRYDCGSCVGKRMIFCVTTGASASNCAYNGREGDSYLHLWPVLLPFRYLGFEVLQPELMHGVGGVDFMGAKSGELSTGEAYLSHWRETVETLRTREVLPFNVEEDFDETQRLKPGAPEYSPFVRHQK
jgi:NAD(P)H dehydrogenase (quinone)